MWFSPTNRFPHFINQTDALDVEDAISQAIEAATAEGAGEIAEKLRQILPLMRANAGAPYLH
jgi:hypothetical protein